VRGSRLAAKPSSNKAANNTNATSRYNDMSLSSILCGMLFKHKISRDPPSLIALELS